MDTFILDLPKNMRVASFELMNGRYITFEEYLEMDVEGAYLEWIDGKVIGFMAKIVIEQILKPHSFDTENAPHIFRIVFRLRFHSIVAV